MPIHTTNTHLVTAMFENLEEARRALQDLRRKGIPDRDISLLSSGKKYSEANYRTIDRAYLVDETTAAETGAGAGATVGGVGGFLAGLATIPIPGLGPVLAVGTLFVTTVAGIAAGGLAGGLIGALVDLGVPEERARLYETGVREGYVLVATQAPNEDVSVIKSVYAKHNPIEMRERLEV